MSKNDSKHRGTTHSASGARPSAVTVPSPGQEASGYRHQRLEQLLREEIGSLLRDEVSDPSLDGVQVTAVLLSVDYKNARVHFTTPGTAPTAADRERVSRALARAAPFFRARLVDSLDLKRAPDLRFVFDGASAL
jgi:ribosome-binding factor A